MCAVTCFLKTPYHWSFLTCSFVFECGKTISPLDHLQLLPLASSVSLLNASRNSWQLCLEFFSTPYVIHRKNSISFFPFSLAIPSSPPLKQRNKQTKLWKHWQSPIQQPLFIISHWPDTIPNPLDFTNINLKLQDINQFLWVLHYSIFPRLEPKVKAHLIIGKKGKESQRIPKLSLKI